MEMMEAMQACSPGGYVARKAYPNRKYFKDENGVFHEAVYVDYLDFISTDWEHNPNEIKKAAFSPNMRRLGGIVLSSR